MQDVNFTWPQGEDMFISLRYKEGPTAARALPVDLANGYTAQMSLANSNSPLTPVQTYTSALGDILLYQGINEPNIKVRLPRAHTLTGGTLTPGSYLYDIFLRNDNGDQIKVVEGTINVKRSITQWL